MLTCACYHVAKAGNMPPEGSLTEDIRFAKVRTKGLIPQYRDEGAVVSMAYQSI